MPSTAIRRIVYRHEAEALDIEFLTGRVYRYLEVPGTSRPASRAIAPRAATSIGRCAGGSSSFSFPSGKSCPKTSMSHAFIHLAHPPVDLALGRKPPGLSLIDPSCPADDRADNHDIEGEWL